MNRVVLVWECKFVHIFCVFLLYMRDVIDRILCFGLTAGVCCRRQPFSERLTFLGCVPVTVRWLQGTFVDVEQSVSLSESMGSVYVALTGCFLNFCGLRGSWEDNHFHFHEIKKKLVACGCGP